MKLRTFAAFVAGNLFAYATALAVVALSERLELAEKVEQSKTPPEVVPGFGQKAGIPWFDTTSGGAPWINPHKWGQS